jgi:ribosome-associated translation inhibitor RaiA
LNGGRPCKPRESRRFPLGAVAQTLPTKRVIYPRGDPSYMRIAIVGDDSISPQARTYAEYRLFAALSQVVDTRQVIHASIALRRAKNRRRRDGVICTVTVELGGGEIARLRTYGDHPYAAINRAVERLRSNSWPARDPSTGSQALASE